MLFNLIKFIGFKNIIPIDNSLDIIVSSNGSVDEIPKSSKCYNSFVIIINIIYKILIFSLISFPFVLSIHQSIEHNNIRIVFVEFFTILNSVVYLAGIVFFRKMDYDAKMDEWDIDLKNQHRIFILSILIPLFIAICKLVILLTSNDYTVYIYYLDGLTNLQKIFMYILIFSEKFISHISYIIILLLFIITMFNFSSYVKKFGISYENRIRDIQTFNVPDIIIEYSYIRHNYEIILGNYSYIFFIINIFGSLSLYFTLYSYINRYNHLAYSNILEIILYLTFLFSYLLIKRRVKSSISKISKIHTFPAVINIFFTRDLYNLNNLDISSIDENNVIDINVRNNQIMESLNSKTNWKILKDEFEKPINDFSYFNNKLTGLDMAQKIIFAIISILLSIRIFDIL